MLILFFLLVYFCVFFFFQAEDGIRDWSVTGVQTCALPIWSGARAHLPSRRSNSARPYYDREATPGGRLLSYTCGPGRLRVMGPLAPIHRPPQLLLVVWLLHWQIGRASCRERV